MYNVAELLLEADHPDVALFYAEIARSLDPAKPDTHLLLGEIEQAEGRDRQAARDFLAVPDGSHFGLLAGLSAALSLERAGDTKQAMAVAGQLVKSRPNSAEAQIGMADLMRRQSQFKPAIAGYTTALASLKDTDDRRATVIFARGIAHDQLHEHDATEADLKQAAALAPERAPILNYLGYFWASRNEHLPEAQAMLEHAYKLTPTDGAVVDSLGWVLYQQGDYTGAVDASGRRPFT